MEQMPMDWAAEQAARAELAEWVVRPGEPVAVVLDLATTADIVKLMARALVAIMRARIAEDGNER